MRCVKDVPALIKYHAMNADGTVTYIHMVSLMPWPMSEACKVSKIRHIYKMLECQFHILHALATFVQSVPLNFMFPLSSTNCYSCSTCLS